MPQEPAAPFSVVATEVLVLRAPFVFLEVAVELLAFMELGAMGRIAQVSAVALVEPVMPAIPPLRQTVNNTTRRMGLVVAGNIAAVLLLLVEPTAVQAAGGCRSRS